MRWPRCGTGVKYGLKVDWWIDERRDVIEATGAALTYLQYLNGYFKGDWYLAIAAYNAACFQSLVAAGAGEEALLSDETHRRLARERAIHWLLVELEPTARASYAANAQS